MYDQEPEIITHFINAIQRTPLEWLRIYRSRAKNFRYEAPRMPRYYEAAEEWERNAFVLMLGMA
jgi:hypothetical protein